MKKEDEEKDVEIIEEEANEDSKFNLDFIKEKLKTIPKKDLIKTIAICILSVLLYISLVYSGSKVNLQNEVDELTTQTEVLQNQVNELTNDVKGKETTINETKKEVNKLKDEKKKLEEEKSNLEKEKEEISQELEALKISKANKSNNSSSSGSTASNSSNRSSSTSSSSSSSSGSSTISVSSTYIINTNTGKFHKPNCASVSRMKDSNKQSYSGSRDELVSQGYSPCKNCNP